MIIHRLILLLFVLLQGVAPLLHAHAGGPSEQGVHLHGWTGGAPAGQVVLEDGDRFSQSALVSLVSSLQPRDDAGADQPCLPAAHLLPRPDRRALSWVPSTNPVSIAPAPGHLLPPALAPPRA